MKDFPSQDVEAAFDAFSGADRDRLLPLRDLIFEVSAGLDRIECIEESLKWGQPSYAPKPKTGTPVRLGLIEGVPSLFVNCSTSLLAEQSAGAPPTIAFSGNRGVIVHEMGAEERAFLRSFVQAAFLYHVKV